LRGSKTITWTGSMGREVCDRQVADGVVDPRRAKRNLTEQDLSDALRALMEARILSRLI
jgi:hypothetical protein